MNFDNILLILMPVGKFTSQPEIIFYYAGDPDNRR